ncbi:class I adenylate-forming enzyme family protein [Saccharopolyspora sp. NFXS83]|uniref:class I adenylate-forming enzyme family protein n=1 Tax=Saccharopolyspora sp. NFXS83 TaxID=2993560 RepID=UPI00224AE414|nr:class I adenylate-forming enzyme family protein [Saccharopolyspora sp. NFXS83]MCX2730342.1 class I adenylate-forming enzyme family protein [Saccharopolyspora sp. NFXS83]
MLDRERLLAEFTGPGGEFELVPRDVRGIPMRIYATGPQTLRDVLLSTAVHGGADYLVFGEQRWTFTEHLRVATGLAASLLTDFGLRQGDRVAIAMRNYPEWAPIFWAVQAAGLVAVPLNAWWTGPELRFALEDSGARVLFADAERVARLAPDFGELDVVQVRGDSPQEGVRCWDELLAELGPDAALPGVVVDPDDDATIMYTSGTTGRPKGAVASHRNHCTNLWNMALGRRALQAAAGVEPDPDARPSVLLTFPIFHIAGLSGLCSTTLAGGKLATMHRWEPREAIRLVREEHVNTIAGVPTVLRELVRHAEGDLSTVEAVNMGGAPIPPDLVGLVHTSFTANVAPGNGYGLTETTSAVVSNNGPECVAHPDSVGRCVPGADLRVVDPATAEDVPAGEIGELWFRGPNVVRGYWNDPKATAEAFVDGWFRTGDLGYVTDGLVRVVDRLKDIVIRGGENVYCAEVEAALFEHPEVADAAVVGVPHPDLGEQVAAIVQVHDGAELDPDELRHHVAERLAAFKVPDQVSLRTEAIPRTSTGKVLKRDLRRELTS